MPGIPLYRRDGSIADYALVDDEDFAALAALRWYRAPRGYACRQHYIAKIDGREIRELHLMHRRIMGLVKGDGLQVDHINRNKLDNRRANLRVVAGSKENNQNLPGGHGLSGLHGVHWRGNRNRWIVKVCHDGKQYLGGSYTDPAEAARAAIALRLKIFPYAHD